MEHQIDGIHLLSKKATKQKFRASIFSAWNHECAYCGAHATTIDHVRPKAKGGTTSRDNCVPACLECNISKAHSPVWIWWMSQIHWSPIRAKRVYYWIRPADFPSDAQCRSEPAIGHWNIDLLHRQDYNSCT
jgi:hypothetical protein